MTKVILVRHGLTVWNHTLRYQGHADIPLAKEGIEQATKVGQRLASEKIAAIYASDLGRAAQTAEAIAVHHGLPVSRLSAIREINFGAWEGRTYKELQVEYADIIGDWFERPADMLIPQGETFRQVKDRSYRALLELVDKHCDETIVVVSHGGTIRAILCAVLDLDLNKLWQIKQDNTAVSVLEFFGTKAMVSLVNDTHHLLDI